MTRNMTPSAMAAVVKADIGGEIGVDAHMARNDGLREVGERRAAGRQADRQNTEAIEGFCAALRERRSVGEFRGEIPLREPCEDALARADDQPRGQRGGHRMARPFRGGGKNTVQRYAAKLQNAAAASSRRCPFPPGRSPRC